MGQRAVDVVKVVWAGCHVQTVVVVGGEYRGGRAGGAGKEFLVTKLETAMRKACVWVRARARACVRVCVRVRVCVCILIYNTIMYV